MKYKICPNCGSDKVQYHEYSKWCGECDWQEIPSEKLGHIERAMLMNDKRKYRLEKERADVNKRVLRKERGVFK